MRQAIQSLDLRSAHFKDDPLPLWRQLQAQGPVITSRQTLLGRVAFVVKHDSAQAFLNDRAHFSVDARDVGQRRATGLRWWVPDRYQLLADNMLTHEGSEHERLRGAVDVAFRRSALTSIQPRIDSMAERLVTAMGGASSTDWVAAVARPLPRDVISGVLGFDRHFSTDRTRLDHALNRLASVRHALDLFRVAPAVKIIEATMRSEIRLRRAEPTDDLLGRLITAGTSIDPTGSNAGLNEDELVSMSVLLYAAGHETTTHLMSTALLTLLRTPGAREALPMPVTRQAVVELARHAGPVQFTKPRFVIDDMTFEGITLRRGESVSALIAAAGHDPDWTVDPSTLDFDRRSRTPLSFGAGPHHCLGQQLALAETASALTAVFSLFPDVRLAEPTAMPTWTRRLGLRSLDRLPLRLRR